VRAFLFTSASGWIATLLVAGEVLLPYLLRRSRLSVWLGIAEGFAQPYLVRMWPHYWAGYMLLALALAHAWVPMQAGYARHANATGLWMATAAFVALLLQVVLGFALQDTKLTTRATVRRWHYWLMVAIVGGVAVHIWLNR